MENITLKYILYATARKVKGRRWDFDFVPDARLQSALQK